MRGLRTGAETGAPLRALQCGARAGGADIGRAAAASSESLRSDDRAARAALAGAAIFTRDVASAARADLARAAAAGLGALAAAIPFAQHSAAAHERLRSAGCAASDDGCAPERADAAAHDCCACTRAPRERLRSAGRTASDAAAAIGLDAAGRPASRHGSSRRPASPARCTRAGSDAAADHCCAAVRTDPDASRDRFAHRCAAATHGAQAARRWTSAAATHAARSAPACGERALDGAATLAAAAAAARDVGVRPAAVTAASDARVHAAERTGFRARAEGCAAARQHPRAGAGSHARARARASAARASTA